MVSVRVCLVKLLPLFTFLHRAHRSFAGQTPIVRGSQVVECGWTDTQWARRETRIDSIRLANRTSRARWQVFYSSLKGTSGPYCWLITLRRCGHEQSGPRGCRKFNLKVQCSLGACKLLLLPLKQRRRVESFESEKTIVGLVGWIKVRLRNGSVPKQSAVRRRNTDKKQNKIIWPPRQPKQ